MKVNSKIAIFIALVVIVLVCIFSKSNSNLEENIVNDEHKDINILMINYCHQGDYWEGFVLEGLKKELSNYKDHDINLKVEYLDFRSKNKGKKIININYDIKTMTNIDLSHLIK